MKVIHNARFERRVLAAIGITLDGVFDTLTWGLTERSGRTNAARYFVPPAIWKNS